MSAASHGYVAEEQRDTGFIHPGKETTKVSGTPVGGRSSE